MFASHRRSPRQVALGVLAACCLAAPPAKALTFDFSFTAGTSAQAQAAFIAAGQLWSSVLSDPITLQLTVGTAALGGSTLAQAQSNMVPLLYQDVRSAMAADATSSSDALAVANLQAGPTFNLLMNRTIENPNLDPAEPYVDNSGGLNNSYLGLTTANAAALGLSVNRGTLAGCLTACDAFIQFNSSFTYDFDRGNGITANQFDFVGIAAHEIGHSLGFVSGVDALDNVPGFGEDAYAGQVSVLDLFRYSAESLAEGVIDFTASATTKYFSLTGASSTLLFSTGVNFGDTRQASHWKDSLGLGMLDPTTAPGELLVISANDRLAMDAIGWNLTAVPEPGKPVLLALGLAVLGIGWRRRNRHA